jgi:hypothetical protein
VCEIGMSHNGIGMLYHILNRIDDVYERVLRLGSTWVLFSEKKACRS